MGDNSNATPHCQQLPFLPDELISHILSWLPVKSLVQFKRVCKSWQTIISNPQFANNHLRNSTLNPTMTHQRVICSMIGQTSKIVSYPMKPLFESPSETTEPVEFTMEQKFHILGSCNGLLCLFHMYEGYVMLWNPCIRFESKKSPPLDFYDKLWNPYWMILLDYGFGYDHVNEKYKVLVVVSDTNTCCRERRVTKIYTFGRNSWTTIEYFSCDVNFRTVGKLVSGTLNWGAFKIGDGSTSYQSVILSFDLEKETYKELLLPDEDGVNNWNHVLGVKSNCLCVGFNCKKRNWNLWVMKKYGVAESWTRLIMIPYEQLLSPLKHLLYYSKPLIILENNIGLFSTHTKFVLLNLNNGRVDDCLLGSPYIGSIQYIYYASLISPQL